jgi:hypothetical protein
MSVGIRFYLLWNRSLFGVVGVIIIDSCCGACALALADAEGCCPCERAAASVISGE